MVRWIDGFYGGLIAGGTSALFYAVVAVAWLHDITLGDFLAQIAQALPPLFEGLMELRPLLRRQDPSDAILAARKNSFGLAEIDRAAVGQLIIDFLQDRPNLLVLLGR